MKSKSSLKVLSVLLSVFLVVSMIPTMVFAGSEDAIEIVSQPESITASAGEQKDLSVVAENATSYQWQRSSDNGQNWSNIGSTNSNYTNAKTDTMTVKVNKTTAGFVYKCVVKNSAGSVSTEIVSITLLQQLEITSQPNSLTGISGDEKVMKVTATNASSYQWQRSSDDGESWSNIGSSNVNYSNAKTAALTIKINKNTAGFVYRCVVKNSENTVNSEVATVTVILPVVIKADPKDISAPSGEQKTMSVVAENATSYQWQRSSDNGDNWSNIGSTNSNYTNAKTDTLTVKVNKTTAGFVYRCMVKNSAFTEYTRETSVTVAEPVQELNITAQPADISGQIGEAKTISVEAANATSYQWQRSVDGQTWSSISTSNSNYSGAKTASLTVNINKNTASYVYRCVVKNSAFTEETEYATVSIFQPLEISEQPESVVANIGEEGIICVVASNVASYQWQRSTDGDVWSNISATNSNYSGAKTDALTIKVNKTTKAYRYRCVVKGYNGEVLESEDAEVKTYVIATFDANGGSYKSQDKVSYTLVSGRWVSEMLDIDERFDQTAVREGYGFAGWYLDAECTERVDVFNYRVTEDVTFYAKWAKYVKLTWISYDGSSYTQTVCQGRVLGDYETPRREGYVFDGWYLDPDYTEELDTSTYVATEDVNIYEKWTAVDTVTITWNGNGGYLMGNTGTYEPIVTNKANKGSKLYCYTHMVKNEGYAFDGFFLDADCTESVDIDNYELTKDVTIYLKWTPGVMITWDANGGNFEGYPDSTTIVVVAKPNSLIDHEYSAQREGYVLYGWYLDASCTTRVDFYTYTPTEDTTFYAKWAEAITVTWNGNGGYFGGGAMNPTITSAVAKDYTIDSYYNPDREGYVFVGWCLDDDCTEIISFGEYIPTEDVTFYAKWAEPVNVTWDGNGGYIGGDSACPTFTNIVAKDQRIGYYYEVKKEGYAFDGWYLDAECTESVDVQEYIPTGDVTFYAKMVEAVTVTWDGNGGYIWGSSEYPTRSENLPKGRRVGYENYVSREGYVFDGWYLDAECTEYVDVSYYTLTEDVTFYAKWIEGVTVTWNCNGGYYKAWEGDSRWTIRKETVLKNETISYFRPLRDGYAFEGWYLDEDCTIRVNFDSYITSDDVTFYANWSEGVTVTWDANGGEFWEEKYTYSGTYLNNQEIHEYAATPYYEGYAFVGWYLDSSCTTSVDTYYFVPTEDVTFYAKWAEAVTVTWDANGGEFWGTSYTETQVVVKGLPLNGSYFSPSRSGYCFDGWYLDADCTIELDEYDYVPTEDVSFYAKWVEAVTVTWDGNGGYIWGNSDYPTYTEELPKGREIGYTNSIAREGYTFAGWYFDEDCTEVADPGHYVFTEDITFYAKWDKGVIITWDANGGEFWEDQYQIIDTVAKNQYFDEYCGVPLKDGYVFVGWCLDADCTVEADYSDYFATEDMTFYAKWEICVMVTWNANGGEFGESEYVKTQMVPKDRLIYNGYSLPWPSRSGYIFDGWYLDESCTEEVDFNDCVATEDISFYAKWAEAVTVTWDANGGEFWENNYQITDTVVVNGYVTEYCGVPYKEGYAFVGWCTSADCSEEVDFSDYVATVDVTFYAKWVKGVTVTWDATGGFFWGSPEFLTCSQEVRQGQALNYTEYPSRDGYIFDGWYLDAACTESVYPYDYIPTEDVTFFAKWVEGVTVTWDGNGGYIGETGFQTYSKTELKGEELNDYESASREGYAFDGWYLDASCTISVNPYYYVPTEDVTFYAKWIEGVAVTWDANGGYIFGDYLMYTQMAGKGKLLNDSQFAEKDGYYFGGWCLDADCTEVVDTYEYVPVEDVTFYAKWIAK